MFDAIGEAGVHCLTTKVEIWLTGVAHRPFANLFSKVEQACLVSNFRAGLCGYKTARWRRWDRCLLITRALAQETTGADRNNTRLV